MCKRLSLANKKLGNKKCTKVQSYKLKLPLSRSELSNYSLSLDKDYLRESGTLPNGAINCMMTSLITSYKGQVLQGVGNRARLPESAYVLGWG